MSMAPQTAQPPVPAARVGTTEPAAPITAEAEASARRARRKNRLVALAFLAPFLVAFLLFVVWPMIHGFYLSFTNQSLTGAGGSFIGGDNYAEAFSDPKMWGSIRNTVWFTLISTVPLVIIAMAMALLVNTGLPGQWLWRLSFFMPFLLASTVISQIWSWLLDPEIGLANEVLTTLGFEPIAWLQTPHLDLISITVATVWWTVGFNFLLYLAALQNIPEVQYEAAAVDGASRWRQIWSITIPQLMPVTGVVFVLQILASLKLFDQAYQMLGGVSSDTSRPIVQYIFEAGFVGYEFGYAAAISYVFFALILVVGIVQITISNRRKGQR
ncbi:carbohydrate ABC transporter permease [Nesterenkonia halobia]|uniref:Sugar ABC transporter permease n=1 Tax=Nesterenkonia halobia TaxID=37922 RepID=A0ABP6R844_9MICC